MGTVSAIVDEGLGNSSYFVDLGDGSALVVDPTRDPVTYLRAAERSGLRIRYAADTHLHADFVSGGPDLVASGAMLLAPAAAHLGYDHRGLQHDEEIDLGGLTLKAIATPGHTPEHLSYLITDEGRPIALFTGGSLIVGSVARTDLISDEQTDALTRAAYRSARAVVDGLPGELSVYPTHGGGSFCSVGTGSERTTTVEQERRTNAAFVAPTEDSFVDSFLGGLGSFPPYFFRMRAINQRGADLGSHTRPLVKLGVDAFVRAVEQGAVVVDARPFEEFAAGHVPGSISIELRPQFASWLGWVVPEDVPLLFVLNDGQDRSDLLRQSFKIGYDTVAGELEGGIEAWRSAGLDVATVDLVGVDEANGTFVDVRQSSELSTGMIPGALHAEAGDIDRSPLPDVPLTLHCGHGQRAMTAASLLKRSGRRDASVLVGGPEDWSAAHGDRLVRVG